MSPVETPAGLNLLCASNCGHKLDELTVAASLGLPSGLEGLLSAEKVHERERFHAVRPVQ